MENKDVVTSIRVTGSMHEKVKRQAEDEGRTLADQYRWIVGSYLKKGEKDGN